MSRRRSIQPLLLALAFLGPVFAAAMAYYGPWEWAPRAAHGDLIEPTVALPSATVSRLSAAAAHADSQPQRWSLVYARLAPCADECMNHLVRLRQVHLALAEERARVQVVLLLTGATPPLPPDATWISIPLDEPAGEAVVALLGESKIRDGRIYIADPFGNLVMSYAADAEQAGMLQDLERLVRLVVLPPEA